MNVRRLLRAVWPAFLVAGVTHGLVFSALDPAALEVFGRPVHLSAQGVYSLGFFLAWIMCCASSALSLLLYGPSDADT